MKTPADLDAMKCWLCDRSASLDGLLDGLCVQCAEKGEGIEVPIKIEEYERMKMLHRLVSSAVFCAIDAADQASARRFEDTETGSEKK